MGDIGLNDSGMTHRCSLRTSLIERIQSNPDRFNQKKTRQAERKIFRFFFLNQFVKQNIEVDQNKCNQVNPAPFRPLDKENVFKLGISCRAPGETAE